MSQTASVPPWINRMMKFLLRSPAHGLVSKSVLLISFTGRKSGKRYVTPVSYSRDGDLLTIFTHAGWWRNLPVGRPVTVRLQGQNRQGLVEREARDRAAIAAGLAAHLRRVPSDARWYGVALDGYGSPNPADVENAAQSVVMLRLRLG